MLLYSLSLTNFRNYSRASFDFSPQTTLVVGPNASGKTNLLEAIYFLAAGRSFRATYDREAIRSGEGFARIEGIKGVREEDEGDEGSLEVQIVAGDGVDGNVSRKRFQVNGIKRRLSDFAGNLRAVYFGPEEIQLVTGSPSKRRKFMDSVLVQVDREYGRALLAYEKVLRQRNRLLLMLREKGIKGVKGVNEQMGFWDEKLLALGSILSTKRQEMLGYFNERLGGNLVLDFLISRRPLPQEKTTVVREREIAAGMTLWGPHREDFVFKLKTQSATGGSKLKTGDGRDLSAFGSRGEQRLAVLHLKLAELEFITERVGERPILLLDDIFSELDENNRSLVLELLGEQQTIVTSTETDVINSKVKTQMSKSATLAPFRRVQLETQN